MNRDREVKVKNGKEREVGKVSGVSNGHRTSPKKTNGVNSDKPGNKTDMYHVKLTLIISLLAWPIVYGFNSAFTQIESSQRAFWMMAGGFLVLLLVSIGAYIASKIKDWLYFGITVFAFSSVIDLIITLEFLGFIRGFMSEYLKLGEPYLFSSWGSAICLFDGIGFFPMYFLIIYFLSNKKSWRSVGLYWAAGILNSMFVLLFGILLGKHPATFCAFLNIPYVVFPIIILFRIFGAENRSTWQTQIKTNVLVTFGDFGLVAGFAASFWIITSKVLLATRTATPTWMPILNESSEKALTLNDPAPFALLQLSLFFFYVLPMIIVSVYHLLKKDKPQYLWEMTVVQCGMLLEAQFTYILYSLDPATPAAYRVDWTDLIFWSSNLFILIIPHAFLFRLYLHRSSSAASKRK